MHWRVLVPSAVICSASGQFEFDKIPVVDHCPSNSDVARVPAVRASGSDNRVVHGRRCCIGGRCQHGEQPERGKEQLAPRDAEQHRAAERDEQKGDPGDGEKATIELIGRHQGGERDAGAVVRRARGGDGLRGMRPRDRLRLRLRLRDRLRLRRGRLPRLACARPARCVAPPAPASPRRGRCEPVRHESWPPEAPRARRRAAADPETASPPGPAGRGLRTAAPDLLPECPFAAATTIFPVVPYPPDLRAFSRSYCGFSGVSTRRLAPQAGPVPACGATPFVYSARDLPVAFLAASCSAADRPSANWLFLADWPTACVPPPPD